MLFFNSFNGGLWRETGGILVWTKYRGSSIEVRPIRTQSFLLFVNTMMEGGPWFLFLLFYHRKLAVYDEWSSIVIHIAMDNTVIENDIS